MFLFNLIKKTDPKNFSVGWLLSFFFVFCTAHTFGKSKILNESLATIQAKALKGDIYYQGANVLIHEEKFNNNT